MGEEQDEMEKAKVVVDELLEKVEKGLESTEELEAWADGVRVAGRSPMARFYLRKKKEVFDKLADILESPDSTVELSITSVSAFANVVIDDDVDFSACTNCCTSGLLNKVLSRGKQSVGKNQESKLQYTIAIALTNFAIQLEEQLDYDVDADDENKPIIAYLLEPQNDPIPFAFDLLFNGSNKLVKRAAVSLIARLAEFDTCQKRIFKHEKIGELLLHLCESCYSEDASEQIGALESITKLWTKNGSAPPDKELLEQLMGSGTICIVSTLVRGTAEVEGSQRVFSDKASLAAVKTLNSLLGYGKEDDMRETRKKSFRECGVMNMIIDKLSVLVDSEEKREAYGTTIPGESLVEACDLYLELLEPISKNDTLLDEQLARKADEVFVHHTYLCGKEMQRLVDDAKARRKAKQSLDEDVDRKTILRFAKLRKVTLYLVAQFATNEDRCMKLVKRKEESLLSAQNPSVIPLCVDIAENMAMFDIEATNTAMNLLRNLCITQGARDIALQQVDAERLGAVLLGQVKLHNNINTSCVAAAITRFFCSSRHLETIQSMFPPAALMDAINMDTTKMHPVVRAELARSLSHILVAVSTEGKDSEIFKSLFTVDVIRLVVYLLQSHFEVLVTECVDSLILCPDELLAKAGSEVQLFFAKSDVEQEGLEEHEYTDAQIEADIEKEVDDKLQKLELSEEDVDMHDPKPSANPNEKKEDLVAITLKQRVEKLLERKVRLDSELNAKTFKGLKRISERMQ